MFLFSNIFSNIWNNFEIFEIFWNIWNFWKSFKYFNIFSNFFQTHAVYIVFSVPYISLESSFLLSNYEQCEELTHWNRLWCWEGLGARGEGDDRGWDGWMASLTRWMWVWVNSGSWWWTGRPGVLWFMGLQRVGHDWATELNWTESLI